MDGCVALWGVLMAGLLTGSGCRTALLTTDWDGNDTTDSDCWLADMLLYLIWVSF